MNRITKSIVLVLPLVGSLALSAYCADAGLNISGGNGQSGSEVFGSVDFGHYGIGDTSFGSVRNDPIRDWTLAVDYVHSHSNSQGSESRTDEYSGRILHATPDDTWEFEIGAAHWYDAINLISYLGPSVGISYNWKREDPDAPPYVKFTANGDFYNYTASVPFSAGQQIIVRAGRRKNKVINLPPGTTELETQQLHPNFRVDVPLFNEHLTPFLAAGHYYYTQDPGNIEAISGRPRFGGSAGQLNSLTGGFLENTANVGTAIALPWDIDCMVSFGESQQATDDDWGQNYEVTLTQLYFDHLKPRLDWTQSILDGFTTNVYTVGLSWLF